MHAHYAVQIAFGSEPSVRARTSERDNWAEYPGLIVPSRQPHAFDGSRVKYWVVMFVEPETIEGRALARLHQDAGIVGIPEETLAKVVPGLISAWREQRSAGAVVEAAKRVIHAITGDVEPSVVSDERILRAIAYINSHLGAPLTLEEVAAEACLSPSRFRHLFVEETGTALRPYILWRRFLKVWELLMDGESLSAAAHAAGFADAAHLTRTSRRMFGFPPSLLQMMGPMK
jgi:AraC-like DNA-binding protein